MSIFSRFTPRQAVTAVTVALAATANAAQAQVLNPNVGTLAGAAEPIISNLRLIMAIICIILSLFQAFKAARGEPKDWIKALLLIVAAAVLLNPDFLFTAVGINGVDLQSWGITGMAGS